jgi:hypothetical protein
VTAAAAAWWAIVFCHGLGQFHCWLFARGPRSNCIPAKSPAWVAGLASCRAVHLTMVGLIPALRLTSVANVAVIFGMTAAPCNCAGEHACREPRSIRWHRQSLSAMRCRALVSVALFLAARPSVAVRRYNRYQWGLQQACPISGGCGGRSLRSNKGRPIPTCVNQNITRRGRLSGWQMA